VTFLLLALGLLCLTAGGELLVRGASRCAGRFGVSPLVIGLTVVAYGTSAPELTVSVLAGLRGKADLAVANVVGSNIFNVLFILGLCAVISPLVVALQLIRLEVPIMVGVSVLCLLLAIDGRIGPLEGGALFAGIIVYTVWAIRRSRRESAAVQAEYAQEYTPAPPRHGQLAAIALDGVLVLGGLVVLVLGSRWVVDGATALAVALGASDVVIGLTIVAAGTSLPELATSLVATVRGERDIAIGNVIGSNIYNVLAILGIAGLVTPGGLVIATQMVRVDLPVMIAVALVCYPFFRTGHQVSRLEGATFLTAYGVYTLYLILNAMQHPALAVVMRLWWVVAAAIALVVAIAAITSRWLWPKAG
jgi:cation:H+ antiporter